MNAINHIIIPEEASALELFAAEELAYFYKLTSGVAASIVPECLSDKSQPFFSVGETEFFKSLYSLRQLLRDAGQDGYRIIVTKGYAAVCGGAGQGTIYGVYGLLKRLFNLTIYTDEVYTYDTVKDLNLKSWKTLEKPDFPMRAIGIYPVHLEQKTPKVGNKRYCYRMRLRQMDEGWGINNHSYFRILPPCVYRAQNPEWYDSTGSTLCLSNKNMTWQFVKNMKSIIEQTPNDTLYMLGMEDTPLRCDCAECKKAVKRYGGKYVALMLLFTNRVVKALNRWLSQKYPARKICFFTFAYLWAKKPPVKKDAEGNLKIMFSDLKPAHNLGVLIAPLHSNANYSLRDNRNIETLNTKYDSGERMPVREIFEGWRAIADKIAVWTYNQNFHDYICPCPMWNGLDENYRWLKELGAYHVFLEAGCDNNYSNFSEMKIFCVSRLMWDTSLDLKSLIHEFMDVYYGQAQPELYEYFNLLHEHAHWLDVEKNRKMLFVHFDEQANRRILKAEFWSKAWLKQAIAIFDRAAAKKLPDEIRLRVSLQSVPVKFCLLYLYRQQIDRPYALRLLADIADTAQKTGMRKVWDEQPSDIKEVIALWQRELNA